MKLEEVNLKTKEAVDYLVQSLESGQSAVLTQYLGAMAKFRNYSFGNIMLIARQKPTLPTLPDTALGLRLAASSGVAKKAFSFSLRWSGIQSNKEDSDRTDNRCQGGLSALCMASEACMYSTGSLCPPIRGSERECLMRQSYCPRHAVS
jgi:hypothetical protein